MVTLGLAIGRRESVGALYAELNHNLAKALGNPTDARLLGVRGGAGAAGAPRGGLGADRAGLGAGPERAEYQPQQSAKILNALGRAEEAEQAVRLAMRVDPHYGPDILSVLGRALLHQERYEEAAGFLGSRAASA